MGARRRLRLGAGTDELTLANGANTITVTSAETITGGTGADVITLGAAQTSGTISLGNGVDSLTLSSAGANTVSVDGVEQVIGGTAADTITVTDALATRLIGGLGNDSLTGGGGADQITGGEGRDTMTGAAGVDRFIFGSALDSPAAAGDTITDFATGSDLLVFSGLEQGMFSFLGSGTLTGMGASEASFNDATKLLSVDVDGDGTADIAMTLTGVSLASLSSTDFLWL